jgi:hypothetical protein
MPQHLMIRTDGQLAAQLTTSNKCVTLGDGTFVFRRTS